jgi:hypothetical protein
MSILAKFRASPRTNTLAEQLEIERLMKRGPNDRPAGIRHNHALARSTNGLW